MHLQQNNASLGASQTKRKPRLMFLKYSTPSPEALQLSWSISTEGVATGIIMITHLKQASNFMS
jgi:hypothetical protein